MKYVDAQKTCILEIRLPKEITKSPAAMEIFFAHLSKGGADNWGEAFIDGKTRPWFSCEIVSTGGNVRFFIWCSNAKNKNLVESQLYAQYPNLEIFETEDYTKDFYYDTDKYFITGHQYGLVIADVYPIKTYIDYGLGLNEDQKEEYKIDPITPIIEFLGSLKKGENAWIQILLRKHMKEDIFTGTLKKPYEMKKEVQKEIDKIRERSIPKSKEATVMKFPNPTKGELEIIAALERSATKSPFDCMIRNIYIAEKESFVPTNISILAGSLKHFRSFNLNGFRTVYPDIEDWQKDVARIFPFLKKLYDEQRNSLKKNFFYAYKLRSYFEWPYKYFGRETPVFQLAGKRIHNKPFILSTEELATIFHFPSNMVSQTPTLQRVPSKKSEAPSNLPI